jgi:glycosyltransferase involved in cell wall biosynthesis
VAAERNSRIATDWREAALQRWLYRRADAVTVNAAPVVDEIASRLGVPPSRICYVPNGIDLEAWDTSSSAQPTLQVPTNGLHFAVVGGFRPQKNHALLFRTLGSMGKEARRGWTFWCVGDETAGSEEARAVRQLAAELDLGDCVQFAPATPELAAFLGRMDGLVLPSAWEGFPNVVLEALAARVPVVATRVGDVAALVEPGRSGWLVEAGDEPALAASLRELADLLPEERARMGQAGRSRVEQKFQMASIAERYMALYLRLQEDAR